MKKSFVVKTFKRGRIITITERDGGVYYEKGGPAKYGYYIVTGETAKIYRDPNF